LFLRGTSTASAAIPPEVEMTWATPDVFVGEFPAIKVAIRAPSDNPVRVVKPDHVYSKFLQVTLVDSEGRVAPDLTPRAMPLADEADDFVTVEPGRQLEMVVPISSQVPAAGEYSSLIRFRLTDNPTVVYEAEPKLTVREVVPADVRARTVLTPPGGIEAGAGRISIELLVVKTGATYTLLYSRRTDQGAVGGVDRTRLWTADERSPIRAEVQGLDRRCLAGAVRVTTTTGGTESVRWVSFWAGGEVPAPAAEHPSTKPAN